MSAITTSVFAVGETDVPVEIVDSDIHVYPWTGDDIRSYAPRGWGPKLFNDNPHFITPNHSLYDPPDSHETKMSVGGSLPPRGGAAGSDPAFAAEQLLVDFGVSIGILNPMLSAQLPEIEHHLAVTYNNWLADIWLDKQNNHGRWRGSIFVSNQTPELAAKEIDRWAGHPRFAQVLMSPQTKGVQFGDPKLDPIYEAASRNGYPVATHLMTPSPYDQIPDFPVGHPAHLSDHLANWPLLLCAHLSSLVFDGAFERHPDLRLVFVESGFTWALPMMWRMDRMWEARKHEFPNMRRPPSEYVREHVYWTTQPLEDPGAAEFRRYLELMDLGGNILFSTDYPHWSFDSPSWAATRFPGSQREAIMRGNSTRLYGLPTTVPALGAARSIA